MFSKIYVFSLLNLFALAQPPPGPPDYSGDRIAPYPSLTSPSTANTLGTRLFGWQGCGGEGSAESQYIKDAYDDMNRIASLAETSSNIDWKGQAAKDYFGPSAGKNIVRDGTRKEITNIMKSVQQLYSTWWGVRPSLWIRVRCSGGDGKGDPTNECGDAPVEDPDAPKCPDGSSPTVPPGDDMSDLVEAYSDPRGNAKEDERADYSQITFCNAFFAKLTLAQAITAASRHQEPNERMNLQNYDNQARIFIHEATHLDWFMGAKQDNDEDGVPPLITDLQIQYKKGTETNTVIAYGVINSKIVGGYRDPIYSGYYAQRNADSFAWFAMANYVKSKTGSYPFFPTTTRRLLNDPLDYHGNPVILEYTGDVGGAPNFDPAQLAAFSAQSLTSQLPQCGDKSSSNIGSSFRNFSLNTYDSDGDYEPAQLAQRHAWLANGYKLKVSNTKLKILPLGDSITYGFQSTDGNGYRGELFAKLSGNGNTIDLVGSVRSGSMPANSNEGHNGATIDQIASYASASLASRPNVVLVHAGTNDMNLPLDPAGAPSRLGNLIDKILVTCPDALVLVSQIVTSGSAATRANILAYNEAIPGVVAARAAKGSKVMVVDMFTRLLAPDNYADDLHPNDGGYKIMGDTVRPPQT